MQTENDRLDLYHHIQTLRLGGELHLAPIGDHPQRVLDLGTGTGIWAIDFADKVLPTNCHIYWVDCMLTVLVPLRRSARKRHLPHPTFSRATKREIRSRRY